MKRFFALLWVLAAFVCTSVADGYESYYTSLPVEMTAPTLPTIPDNSVSITEFGGVGDGLVLNTEAFARAIAALDKMGGGHLVVPAGVWLTGPIVLKNNIDLHLERNAIVLATPDRTQHLKEGKTLTLISASKRKNISITGEGVIDGNGDVWRPVKRSKVSDTEWKRFTRMGGTIDEKNGVWYPYDLTHLANIAEGAKKQEKLRTHLVRFTDCENVLVKGVTLQNAPKFHLIPTRCKNVVIDGLTVRCPWNAQNGDGIDLSSCRNVLVVNNMVDVGDDGICLKAGAGANGEKYGPCENILIVNNTVNHAHGGFVIGSEFSGGAKNIVVRDNTFSGTDTGLRFKSGLGRGGVCENIYISNIYMTDIVGEAVIFDCTYEDKAVGREGEVATKSNDYAPQFCDIHISDVICRGCSLPVRSTGFEGYRTVYGVTITRSTFFHTGPVAAKIDPNSEIEITDCVFDTW